MNIVVRAELLPLESKLSGWRVPILEDFFHVDIKALQPLRYLLAVVLGECRNTEAHQKCQGQDVCKN